MPRHGWSASALVLTALACGVAGVWLAVLNGRHPGATSLTMVVVSLVVSVALALAGWFLAVRLPGIAIGWLFLAAGVAATGGTAAGQWAYRGLVMVPSALPGATAAAWLYNWLWSVPLVLLGTYVLLLFPDGRLASPRWRPVAWASGAVLAVIASSGAFYPRLLHDQEMGVEPVNPIGLPEAAAPVLSGLVAAGLLLLAVLVAASLISLLLRFRRAAAVERDQIRLVVVTMVLVAALQLLPDPWDVTFSAVGLVPVAVAVAILRRDLWHLDVVVRKTVVLATLSAVITGVYLAAVVVAGYRAGGGGASVVPVLIATVVVAMGLQPLRLWLERIADRLLFGRRATPYEALATLSHRLRDVPSSADVPAHMAEVAATSTGASSARIRVDLPDGDQIAVIWPEGAMHDDPELRLDVSHGGRVIGELSVVAARGEAMRPVELRLLTDLAAQAGPALATVRLTQALRAHLAALEQQTAALRRSQERLVTAQIDERRRLERELHDGVQAHLVGLLIRLGRVTEEMRDSPWVGELQAAVALGERTVEELRELARGVHPGILVDRGVAAALRAYADAVAFPFRLEIRGDGRWDADVETILYFTCLEAVQNAVKHAQPQRITVALQQVDGHVEFVVTDDGEGFDASRPRDPAGGLQQAADRLNAIGGSLTVRSTVGAGTTVSGLVALARSRRPQGLASPSGVGQVQQNCPNPVMDPRFVT
jgi:signal transduction histidine kinase